MHAEDGLAALEVGAVDDDLTVEATRTQERGVEDVGTVGGRQQDHALLLVEAVHLHEQLVECLLALVVPTTEAGTAVTTHGVDLVDEHDRGCRGLGLLEEVTHPRRADAHEHLDEVGAADREERHARLAGDRLGEQGLARARRTVEQDPLGDLRPHLLEARGRLEELLDLLELLDRFVETGDVGEGDLRLVLGERLGLRLAEAHDATAAALHLPEHPHEHEREQHERQQPVEQAQPGALALVIGVELVDAGVDDILGEVRGVLRREADGVFGAVLQLAGDGVVLVLHRGGRDLAVGELTRVAVERDLLGTVALGERTETEEGRHDDGSDHEDHQAATLLGHGHSERKTAAGTIYLLVERPFPGRSRSRRRMLRPPRAPRTPRCRAGCGSARRRRGRTPPRTSAGS